MGDLYEDQDLVICTNIGSIQDPRNVNRVMKRIVEESKVLNIRFHDIRYTHLTRSSEESSNISYNNFSLKISFKLH